MKPKCPKKLFHFFEITWAIPLQGLALFTLLLSSLSLLPSCQSPVETKQPIHQIADYFVRYLAAERQLKAYASFYEGASIDAAAPRKVPGGVSFQGAGMEQQDLGRQGIRYTITRTADYPQPFLFTHQDSEGKPIERTFEMPPLDNFFFEGNISRQKGAMLVVKGAPLQASESLVLLFTDIRNRAYSITLSGPSAENRFPLSPEQLAELPAGSCQLYLVKKKSEVRESQIQTILVAVEFYTKTVQVEIIP